MSSLAYLPWLRGLFQPEANPRDHKQVEKVSGSMNRSGFPILRFYDKNLLRFARKVLCSLDGEVKDRKTENAKGIFHSNTPPRDQILHCRPSTHTTALMHATELAHASHTQRSPLGNLCCRVGQERATVIPGLWSINNRAFAALGQSMV
jgi:hypothetical protein